MKRSIDVVVLDASAERAASLGDSLEALSNDRIEVRAQSLDSPDGISAKIAEGAADAVVVRLAGSGEVGLDADSIGQVAQLAGRLAILVIAEGVALESELEWVHRGIQGVLPVAVGPGDLLRNLVVAMERKHRYNDAQEALRLEQENVLKMQRFIDELVGYATRTAMHPD